MVPEHLQEQLYERLLNDIGASDDVQKVSQLLCDGAPVEPVGGRSLSALQLAVTTDRSRTVNLLLAHGAALPAGLLQVAWQSRDVTPGVLASLIRVSVLPCLPHHVLVSPFSLINTSCWNTTLVASLYNVTFSLLADVGTIFPTMASQQLCPIT